MIYLAVIILLFYFIYQFDIKGKTANRNLCYNTILLFLTLIAGLRYRLGVDTTAYLQSFYHDIPYLWNLTLDDLSITSEPLWTLLNSIIRSIGGRWYIVQLIQAAFVNILVFNYFKKHSKYIFSCVIFYFIWMFPEYTMEEMRASISVVICLYSYDYFSDKHWGIGYMLMIIACLFHRSTFALLITPFLMPALRSNKMCLVIFIISFLVSYMIKSKLSDYISLVELADGMSDIENKMKSYAVSDKYGENNHNLNYYIACIFPCLFSSIYALYFNKSNNDNLKKIKPMFVFGIVCILIEANIYIFYRYVHFFACYIIIYVSHLMIDLIKCSNSHKKYNKVTHLSMNLTKACAILFLFLFPTLIQARKDHEFYPYSSIFERSIDAKREKGYNALEYPLPKNDEY